MCSVNSLGLSSSPDGCLGASSRVINSHPHASNCLPLIITTQLWLIILSKSVGERTFRYRKSLHNFHIGDNLIKYLHLIIRSNAEISNAQQRCHKWD